MKLKNATWERPVSNNSTKTGLLQRKHSGVSNEGWALHSDRCPKKPRKQGLILLSAVWQCDYENQLWDVLGQECSRLWKKAWWSTCVRTQREKSGAENNSELKLKKFFSASSMTIIYRSHWTSLCFMNPDPLHMSRICLVTLSRSHEIQAHYE